MARQYSLSREETEFVIKKGDFISSPFFSGRKMNLNGSVKASIIAPKKVFKLAVDRNKVKRRFREAFRMVLDNISNRSFVFFLKKPAINASLEEIRAEISKVCK